MQAAEWAHGPHSVSQDDHTFPSGLIERLGAQAPKTITIVGSKASLSSPMTAFLCSKETPGATVLKAFDQMVVWRDAGRSVISGFHSPLERQCLEILLRGKQPVVLALARGIGVLRLSAAQRKALADGRLTIVSPFDRTERRATSDLAYKRNRFVAAMADEVVFAFVSPGGNLSRLTEEIAAWGVEHRELHSAPKT